MSESDAPDFDLPQLPRIIRNAARCRRCGDEIESKHRHDFVACSCGAIFVDGGTSYLRRGAESLDLIEERAETEDPNGDA